MSPSNTQACPQQPDMEQKANASLTQRRGEHASPGSGGTDTQSERSLYWHTANGRDLRANYSPKSTGTKQGPSKQKAQGLKTESFIVLPPNRRAEL